MEEIKQEKREETKSEEEVEEGRQNLNIGSEI